MLPKARRHWTGVSKNMDGGRVHTLTNFVLELFLLSFPVDHLDRIESDIAHRIVGTCQYHARLDPKQLVRIMAHVVRCAHVGDPDGFRGNPTP